jgi:hypothetical protein
MTERPWESPSGGHLVFHYRGETLLLFQLLPPFAFDDFSELSFLEFLSPSRRSWLIVVLFAKTLLV